MKHEHLPDGWQWVRVNEIAYNFVERNGDNANRTVMAVTKYDGLVPSLEYFDRQVFSDDISKYKVVYPNQFAYAVIHLDEGSIGMNDLDEPVLVSPVYVVFGLDELKADSKYFRFLLKSDYMMMTYQRIGEGTVDRRKSITFETLGSAYIPLPPIDEQRRIAEVLRDADANIANIEAQIESAQTVKRGVMQRLFTYGLAGEGAPTKHTKIGEIPADWEAVPMRKLCNSIVNGYVGPTKDLYRETGIPYLVSQNVRPNQIILEAFAFVDEEFQSANQRSILHEGDILMVQTGAKTGDTCVVPPEFEGANCHALIISRPDSQRLNSEYASQYFNSPQGKAQLQRIQTGLAHPHLNSTEIRKQRIPFPTIEEQREIAAILNDHDAAIRSLQAESARLREVKRGLMQGLLSGEVRV